MEITNNVNDCTEIYKLEKVKKDLILIFNLNTKDQMRFLTYDISYYLKPKYLYLSYNLFNHNTISNINNFIFFVDCPINYHNSLLLSKL